MADSDTTKAHLTAVGMTGSDAQAARVLTALAGSTLLEPATHDDVAAFVSAAQARFSRQSEFSALSQADEQKLWTYRQIWAIVRGVTNNDAELVTEGWKQTSAAFTELSS